MVKFEDVDKKTKEQLKNRAFKRKGSITKPIIDAFLEQNKEMVKVPFEDSGSKSLTSLYLGLKNYVNNHDVAVEVFMHHGEIYLKRTDSDGETG